MPNPHLREVALRTALTALALIIPAVSSCAGNTGLPDFPTLTFKGAVADALGRPVPVLVRFTQHAPSPAQCGDSVVVQDPIYVSTDSLGHYELQYYAAAGLDGCFKFAAAMREDSVVVDSVILFEADLHELGDPLGSGVVRVDIVISNL